jgi:uncharacterized protein
MSEIYDLLVIVVLFILGVGTGGLSNVTSGGAGVLTIFFLSNYAGLGAHLATATGTVVAASTVICLIGTWSFYKRKQIDWQLGITVGVSGVVGGIIGALLASTVVNSSFEFVFGVFCLALAAYTTYQFGTEWKKKRKEHSSFVARVPGPAGGSWASMGQPSGTLGNPTPSISDVPQNAEIPPKRGRLAGKDPLSLAVQIAKGILIGLATGLFGVALASLSIVLFILLFKLDTKMILGTSLFASVLRYGGASVTFVALGQINLFWFAILAISGAVGSIIGARMVLGGGRFSKDIYVKIIVVLILLFIGYSFITKS